jgi:hypothetical protein
VTVDDTVMRCSLSAERFQLLEVVQRHARIQGVTCYLIGGVIRDLLLDREILEGDIDLVVEGAVYNLVESIQAEIGGTVIPYREFLTAKLIDLKGFGVVSELDFAQARREIYEKPGALPIVQSASITSDLSRRDFAVNAIALPLNEFIQGYELNHGEVRVERNVFVDPNDGFGDLRKRELRILHPDSFIEDPTRIIRMCRYQARLQFSSTSETRESARKALNTECFATITTQRLWNEVKKCLAEKSLATLFPNLFQMGVFNPEMGSRLHGPPSEEIARCYGDKAEPLSFIDRLELFHLMVLYDRLSDEVQWIRQGSARSPSIAVPTSLREYFAMLGVGKRKLKELLLVLQDVVVCGPGKGAEMILLEMLISEYSRSRLEKGRSEE